MSSGQNGAQRSSGKDDLHCHLLPAWDDGAKTFDESLRMAQRAVGAGARRLLVTPHVGKISCAEGEKPAIDIAPAAARLEAELRANGVDIELVAGAEITLSDLNITERIGSEPSLTIGGQRRYALVETPVRSWPRHMDEMLFQISLSGVTPILAHPERIGAIQRDLSIAQLVAERGVLLQVTARSLLPGRVSAETAACARRMFEAGIVSIVASDAHSSRESFPGEVEDELIELIGAEAAHAILVENPRRVLDGEHVVPPKPELKPATTGAFSALRWLFGG